MYRFFAITLGCVTLAACGDPLAKVERLADVPVSEGQTVALALPSPEDGADQPSFLSRWFGGKGQIQFCLLDPSLPGEVEIDLGSGFPMNPQIKGAIKSLGGVVMVEDN